MGQSLWDRLRRGKVPVELQFDNPAKAKIGNLFSIEAIGYRNLMFTLREIHEYNRKYKDRVLKSCDYVLLHTPAKGEPIEFRVRFMPVAFPDSVQTHSVLLLKKYDEMRFNKELDTALRDTTGELVITNNDNGEQEKYWRLNNLQTSFLADVNIIRDANNDGTVEDSEVEKTKVEYWDFSRIVKNEAKRDETQYLFVEMNQDNKIQTMWRGEEIEAERVTIL